MSVKWTKDGLYSRWYGTNAEKVALAGMSVGDKFTETDTGGKFEYSGSAWLSDAISVAISASDIEIGAVELKNGTTDDRAVISATGALSVMLTAGTADIGKVIVSNNQMELYGATIATRPAATAVVVGTTFMVVVAPLIVYMSDGTNWIEVS